MPFEAVRQPIEQDQGCAIRLDREPDMAGRFLRENAWGLLCSIDAHDCDPEVIRDRGAVARYAGELCRRIKVKAFGPAQVVHFGCGQVEGYSLVQLIETSLISGHFANVTNRAFIDIFSCRYYDPYEATRFTAEFFDAKKATAHCLLRK